MTTTRYFEVRVTGCKNCHLSDCDMEVCLHGIVFTEHQNRRASQRFSENFKALTPSCPMWEQTKESETICMTNEQLDKWREEFELAELAWLEDDLPSVKRDLLERKDDKYTHAMMRIKWNVCLATNLRAKQETEQAIKDARKQALEEAIAICESTAYAVATIEELLND